MKTKKIMINEGIPSLKKLSYHNIFHPPTSHKERKIDRKRQYGYGQKKKSNSVDRKKQLQGRNNKRQYEKKNIKTDIIVFRDDHIIPTPEKSEKKPQKSRK